MQLKVATVEDFSTVKRMALAFLKESPYSNYPKDDTKMETIIFSFLLDKEERVCILAFSDEGKPIGIIAGYLNEALFTNEKVASEVMWWVHPDFRKRSRAGIELLEAFQHWSRMVGSSYIQMQSLATTDDSGVVDKIYKKYGFYPKEVTYIKELK